MTSSKLERYTKVIEWDYGYLVVMAKYKDLDEIEEYIDYAGLVILMFFDFII